MKLNRKSLLLILCAVMLVAASVFGTIAYFTDSEAVTNTLTVGKVAITLDEADVDNSTTGDNDRDYGNAYHLIPGETYVKDPTITVLEGSSDCYVRAIVTVSFANALTDETLATELDGIITGHDAAKWTRQSKTVSADGKSIVYEYRYNAVMKAEEQAVLFEGIAIPDDWDNAEMTVISGMNIDVAAHAIQAAGFESADAAWTAFGQQHP